LIIYLLIKFDLEKNFSIYLNYKFLIKSDFLIFQSIKFKKNCHNLNIKQNNKKKIFIVRKFFTLEFESI
jgi:hypothetical protein